MKSNVLLNIKRLAGLLLLGVVFIIYQGNKSITTSGLPGSGMVLNFGLVQPTFQSLSNSSTLDLPKIIEYPDNVVGCFGKFTSVQSKIKLHPVEDLDECKELCAHRFIYYMFYPKKLLCECSDRYESMYSVSPEHCYSNSTYLNTEVVLIGYKYNATGFMVEKYLCGPVRNCRCISPICDAISCSPIADSGCWIGPKMLDMDTKHRACTTEEYTIQTKVLRNVDGELATCQTKNCTYCIKPGDMYGFWPITSCNSYHPLNLRAVERRLYSITPPSSDQYITVFTKRRPNQKKLLLMGYYRSGSTYTSELFRNHKEAFYLFEPFHSIIPREISRQHEEIHDYLINQTTKEMQYLFECNTLGVSYAVFSRFPQADNLIKLCRTRSMIDCMALFKVRCEHQKLIVIKSIRARMQSVKDLVKSSHPDLKVVLLLRDPRGVMNSRLTTYGSPDKVYKNSLSHIVRHAKMLCAAMASDAIIARELKAQYPRQVAIVHYEDIAKYSTTAANYIYRELDLGKPPQDVINAVEHLQGNEKKNPHSVLRNNSLTTAFRWKTQLDYKIAKYIDEVCKDSYSELGYRPLSSARDLTDLNNYHREFNTLV